jgi:hypothetical protein
MNGTRGLELDPTMMRFLSTEDQARINEQFVQYHDNIEEIRKSHFEKVSLMVKESQEKEDIIIQKINELTKEMNELAVHDICEQCPICQSQIDVLVELKQPVHGGHGCQCGTAAKFACLRCARDWMQLNLDKSERKSNNKHFVCQKTFSNRDLNAQAYEVRRDLMEILDKINPIEITHTCRQIFKSRIAVHDHMKDGTCPDSFRSCPQCKKLYKLLPDWVNHVEKCKPQFI